MRKKIERNLKEVSQLSAKILTGNLIKTKYNHYRLDERVSIMSLVAKYITHDVLSPATIRA
jgi:hypothetical protein